MTSFIEKFLKEESAGGIVLFFMSAVAILLANSFLADDYFNFLHTKVTISFGDFGISKPFLLWVNDGFMAVFFLLVGLEVKREIFVGSLSSYQQAILPIIAAIGGMVLPALIFSIINYTDPVSIKGWAIPMATDIAFALGVLALLGRRVPLSLKVFLLALAIIDDLGAIVVIAIFYASELSSNALIGASICIISLIVLNRCKVSSLVPYILVGIILWVCVLKSGVHATLAGVILGFSIPLTNKQGKSPLEHLEHTLSPWSAFFILPIFAFANAGVSFEGINIQMILGSLPLGIMLGLILGKSLGVFGFSFIAIKLKLAQLPKDVTFPQVFAVAVLCGIGFTMAMFLSSLAFEFESEQINIVARLGVLLGSFISALIGFALLYLFTRKKINIENKREVY